MDVRTWLGLAQPLREQGIDTSAAVARVNSSMLACLPCSFASSIYRLFDFAVLVIQIQALPSAPPPCPPEIASSHGFPVAWLVSTACVVGVCACLRAFVRVGMALLSETWVKDTRDTVGVSMAVGHTQQLRRLEARVAGQTRETGKTCKTCSAGQARQGMLREEVMRPEMQALRPSDWFAAPSPSNTASHFAIHVPSHVGVNRQPIRRLSRP
ncbi:uncharacterized protein MAM_03645 [Metarhizium album ARSEF 1941]|uniref:Uncharacterized protein n=1 Tax=Metarhizium album (strain ARSEF 1941) TaxID=1081103 RepID=A0A0B2WR34_METAS|nr:uncharacterized protein MAM_03645 [Metarhizium album ARSEF 1941]KHN98521.1 hypothetical protein MAM_03645 [Metarhizium album ARSEF 1941]